MSLIGTAKKMGVMSDNLKKLTRGEVTSSVAGRLGVSSANLQKFIDGTDVTPGVAHLMASTSDSAKELRRLIGREGAIGLVIGLCIDRASE